MLGFTILAFSDILPVYSGLKLKLTHNLFFNHNACLKRDQLTRWNFFCVQLLTFPSRNVRLCSIAEVFDWEKFWVSSITEPNRSQSNDRRSIEFDYRTFDWLRRAYEISAQFWDNAWHSQTVTSISLSAGRQETPGTFTFASLLKLSSPTVP